MLADEEFYKEEEDRTAEYSDEIKRYIEDLGEIISKKERKFLLDDLKKPRTPVFYGLPKIHKVFKNLPPMRPIVSGYNSITVKMSEYVDSFLKKRAQKCNSYIKDTNDFLQKIQSISDISSKSILVTMDVSSLYTNIDQSEGAEACFENLEQRSHKSVPSNTIKDMIKLVLERNIFRFRDKFYAQRKGTCMGTPMAPNYANIFMDKFERNLLANFYQKTGKRPLIWWRYIDDIFFIWNEDEASLNEFLEFSQNFSDEQKMSSTIKFTASQSTEEVNFLDVRVMLKNGKISTSVYSKPTDSHLYLSQTSNHPRHMINNIPKSQFLRLRRICSETSDFMMQCDRYTKYFMDRGYDEKKLLRTAKEISQIKRKDTLENPTRTRDKENTVFVCDWHPGLAQLPGMIKKHHNILQNDPELRNIFKDPPIVAFRRATTVRNKVVKNDVQPPPKKVGPTEPCGKCSICKIICKDEVLLNTKTGKEVKITAAGSCRSSDVIYAARCKICDLIYVGETEKELRIRFCDHRYDSKSRPSNNDLPEHIHKFQHNFETDIEVVILKQGFKSQEERRYWEDKFMCQLETIDHTGRTGLNKKVGNYAKSMYKMYQNMK
jgi:hypothetical protein